MARAQSPILMGTSVALHACPQQCPRTAHIDGCLSPMTSYCMHATISKPSGPKADNILHWTCIWGRQCWAGVSKPRSRPAMERPPSMCCMHTPPLGTSPARRRTCGPPWWRPPSHVCWRRKEGMARQGEAMCLQRRVIQGLGPTRLPAWGVGPVCQGLSKGAFPSQRAAHSCLSD